MLLVVGPHTVNGERIFQCECCNKVEQNEIPTGPEENSNPELEAERVEIPGDRKRIAPQHRNGEFGALLFAAIEKRLSAGLSPTPDELRRDTGARLVKVKSELKKLVMEDKITWNPEQYRSIRINELH
jgi:hypothetical protein